MMYPRHSQHRDQEEINRKNTTATIIIIVIIIKPFIHYIQEGRGDGGGDDNFTNAHKCNTQDVIKFVEISNGNSLYMHINRRRYVNVSRRMDKVAAAYVMSHSPFEQKIFRDNG